MGNKVEPHNTLPPLKVQEALVFMHRTRKKGGANHALSWRKNGRETVQEEKIWKTKTETEVHRLHKGVLTDQRPPRVDAEVFQQWRALRDWSLRDWSGIPICIFSFHLKLHSSSILTLETSKCDCCTIYFGMGKSACSIRCFSKEEEKIVITFCLNSN